MALAPLASAANEHANYRAVCPGAVADSARCHAQVVTNQRGNPLATTSPTGYGPLQFHTAYSLPNTGGNGQTVAIVDAYDDPQAENDLNVYSSTYGLPSCTTNNLCFRKVNQDGGTKPYPRADRGWALEISLDVQVAHAICPECKILLVEAKTNSYANLMKAVDRAFTMGASVISNSYGSGEFSGETSYDYHFNHPGVAITFSSGDSGYGVGYPAASGFVTAVGGTTLNLNADNTRSSETAWSGAGSGCSAYESKPSWQNGSGYSGCAKRMVADVSADADPNTGASVYDSYGYSGQKGWFQVGGTSLSAPLVGGVYALAGNASSTTYGSYPYSHTTYGTTIFDVTSGSNGSCGASYLYLCSAASGYDGPTGLGTPIGTAAF